MTARRPEGSSRGSSDRARGDADGAREEVGAELRAARERAGLTQAQAARELGVAQTSVSALERGLYLPDPDIWTRLVASYGVGADHADALWTQVRAARTLRGAAAGDGSDTWPLDPSSCSRRTWCGEVRRRHRLTRNELAVRLGVTPNAVAKLEQDTVVLPRAVKDPRALRGLARLGATSETALRAAWQAAEVEGIEHLLGCEGEELVTAARDAIELLRWLLATGRTQSDIAAACGVSRPAVSQWLTGQTTPSTQRLTGLSNLLEVDPAVLQRARPASSR
jgi:transcriptional regulator with XRE-family HTH domain